jgi:hypothetical protein
VKFCLQPSRAKQKRDDHVFALRRKAVNSLDDASPAFVRMSRILVTLITFLLAVIPWSEQYSMLDNFPHGQDTELNLLAFFLILGVILLFARSRTKGISVLFALCYLFFSMLRVALSSLAESLGGVVSAILHSPPLPSTSLNSYNLPLQI